MFLKLCLTSLLISVIVFSHGVEAQGYSEIYVFGDSLSDTGNLTRIVKQELGENTDFPPTSAYPKGRFSNEFVWVEKLAQELDLKPNPKTNFAIGSAQTGIANKLKNESIPETIEISGVLGQVQNNINSTVDSQALYIILGGANDYLSSNAQEIASSQIEDAIANLRLSILRLANAGAKNIIIGNLPDLGLLPSTRGNVEVSQKLTSITKSHNQTLANTIEDIRQYFGEDINIKIFDLYSLFESVNRNPQKFGFTNITQGCLMIQCDNPDQFLFWDGIHPTAKGHQIMSDFALQLLEPSVSQKTKTSPKNLYHQRKRMN